ncbi:hypothetical protein LZL87_013044 [Fusarium oxysporum]|nr:hypothetical protein LZL87_013044 [Fusarium oxysporum]
MAERQKTYNTGDSLVVTDPTTNPALRSLTMGERTGSRILYELWSLANQWGPLISDGFVEDLDLTGSTLQRY